MAVVTMVKNVVHRENNTGDLTHPDGEHLVTMSNALIRAGHGLTLGEKRIISIAISKLDFRRALKPGEIPRARITAAEYAELADCNMPTAYEGLQDAARNLFERKITFFEPAHKRNGKPLKPIRTDMRWVGRCKYHEGEGWVEIAWWPELLPALVGLRTRFTSYQLKQVCALRSTYSWRLLELLMRFESTGWAQYTIEDFKASMDAPPSLSDFAQVKRRIIEPAVKELAEKDGWLINWEAIKAGRRVSALRFEFKRNPQGRLPLDEPKQDLGRSPLALDDPKPKRPRSARSKPTPQPATESPAWTPAAPDHLEPPKLRRPPPVWDEVTVRIGRDKTPTDSGSNENAETNT